MDEDLLGDGHPAVASEDGGAGGGSATAAVAHDGDATGIYGDVAEPRASRRAPARRSESSS